MLLVHQIKGAKAQHHNGLSDLPEEVLVQLLEHVPLQQRLLTCARLSTKFKAAAITSTKSIKLYAGRLGTVFGFQSYLQSHGSSLTSLDLKPPVFTVPFALLELPCPNLRKLQLTDTLVQFTATPGSQQQGVLRSCKALTSLYLRNCNVLDTSAQLAGLSVLQDLQEFDVEWEADCIRRHTQPVSLLPGSLLSQLVKLTSICLSSQMRFADLQHLSCLTGLQVLHVALAAGAQQVIFAGIKQLQQLTCLSLSCFESRQSIGFNETRGLHHLSTLRTIRMWQCQRFRPVVMRKMQDLRDVILMYTNLAGAADGTSSMLALLPHLPAVTRLDLTGTLKHHSAQLSDYTSLGTLTQLGSLTLAKCALPAGLWQQLASGNVRMRSVWHINLNHITLESRLLTSGLSNLVRCFPSLTHVECQDTISPDADLHPLQQLPDLYHLVLSNSSDAWGPTLASLKQLTALEIKHSSTATSTISITGLLQLTALSRLAQLSVEGNSLLSGATHEPGCQCECCAAGTPVCYIFNNKVTSQPQHGVAQVSDIPEQLLHFCVQNSACQHDVLAQLHELQDVQNNLQATRSQLAASQAALATSLATHHALQLQLTCATSAFSMQSTELTAREEKEFKAPPCSCVAVVHKALPSGAANHEAVICQLLRPLARPNCRLLQVAAKEHAAAAASKLVASRQAGLSAAELKLSQQADRVEDMQRLVSRQSAEVSAAQQHVRTCQDAVAAKEQQVIADAAALSARERALARRERQVRDMFSNVTAKEHRMEQSFMQRDAVLASREAAVLIRERQLAAMYAASRAPQQPAGQMHAAPVLYSAQYVQQMMASGAIYAVRNM